MTEVALIQVLDTAVKIGLGALISGVTTYWITKVKSRSDSEKELQLRYRNILEEVSENIEIVNHAYLKYWALVVEWLRYENGNYEWLKKNELEKTKEELFHAFKAITSAEAKLLLVGEKKAYKALHDFGEKVVEFRRTYYYENTKMTEKDMNISKKEISELREEFFHIVSEAYIKT